MAEHTVKSFEEELEAISTNIAQMGGLAEAVVAGAIDAMVKRDAQLAEQMVLEDHRIDELEQEVETRAVRMIALRQPMADDLRLGIAAIKIASDLERIGDLAANIAKRSIVLQEDFEIPKRLMQGIVRMGRLSQGLLKEVLDAYSNNDPQAAADVWSSDEEVDAMYNSVFRELLTYMMEDPRTISACAHLLFVAKNIERIGDHATNIAESVRYSATGERIVDGRPKADETSTRNLVAGK